MTPLLSDQELRHLRRLSGSRLADEQEDVVRAERIADRRLVGPNGQLLACLEEALGFFGHGDC